MIFERNEKVRYYDCDASGRMKASAAVRAMQAIAGDHLDHLNLPYELLRQQHMVFLLTRTCMQVHSMPQGGQDLLVRTAPTGYKGVRFIRDVLLCSEREERLVSLRTYWVLVDPASRKVLRPSAFPYDLMMEDSLTKGDVDELEFPKEEEPPAAQRKIVVQYSMLDNNRHVNNSFYLDFCCDLLPEKQLEERGIDRLAIAYQNEAVAGDTIDLACFQQPDGGYHFLAKKQGIFCFEAMVYLR